MNPLLKKVRVKLSEKQKHWVGNGFYVNGVLRPTKELYPLTSPFLLMDYAAPKLFASSSERRGVGEHPHRGFETVTFALQGEIEHRDSAGGGGIIAPGGVQWMTAGKGIIHDEYHSPSFSKAGGVFEMIQLWVNLPKAYKLSPAKYQGVTSEEFSVYELSKGSSLKIIAGDYHDRQGKFKTFSAIDIFQAKISKGESHNIEVKESMNTLAFIISGEGFIAEELVKEGEFVILESKGSLLEINSKSDMNILILSGQPIKEPFVAHGPFVMSTKDEIYEAILDYQSGSMGKILDGKNES
ncbi:pirin family protein [Halobacteriovorax sp. HLS]|uniref:pirin family protein n=1 Tax=Halobacteriovorax sp. HLS TaxID=2234000 RepID=UPI000FD7B4C1|nr:pirin family protein [Halobacteriovorax sp. HLS]